MPTIQDLNSLMFTDPGMFQQGQQIIDQGMLANQLANQQAQANIDRTTLANQFAAQNNPQLIQHQNLINSELGMKNDLTQSTMDESKQARRAAFMKQLSEDDLSAFTAKAKLDMMSDDPDVAARAKRQLDASKDEIDRREKMANDLEKAKVMGNARITASENAADAAKYRADTMKQINDARMQKANNQAKTIMDAVTQGKFDYQKAATSFGMLASMEEDPQRAAAYNALAQKFEKAQADNVNRLAGKPDLVKLGIDVNQFQSVLGDIPRIPGGMPSGQAPAAMTSSVPTQGGSSGVAGPTNDDRINILYQDWKNASDQDKPAVEREIRRLGYNGPLAAQPAAAKPAAAGTVNVIAPDGRPGTIPADKLDAALKAGFKKR